MITLIILGVPSWLFGGAALVYIGSWILAGTDLTVGVSLGFKTEMVFASAFAGSGCLIDLGIGSDGSCNKKQIELF